VISFVKKHCSDNINTILSKKKKDKQKCNTN